MDKKRLNKLLKELSSSGSPVFEQAVFEYLKYRYDVSKDDLLRYISTSRRPTLAPDVFPISILLHERISGLEAIVKYLRENKGLKYGEIGKILKRNISTIATSYKNSQKKNPAQIVVPDGSVVLEFSIFNDRLSILESICSALRSKGYNYSQIARMIGKDPRTVWTVCKRSDAKLKEANGN